MTDRRLSLLDAIRGVRPPPPPVLTCSELALYLRVSETTFYRWKRSGMFDRLEAGDLPHLYSRAKVDAWLAGKPKGRVA